MSFVKKKKHCVYGSMQTIFEFSVGKEVHAKKQKDKFLFQYHHDPVFQNPYYKLYIFVLSS
jgi:hypothetical protein